MKDSDCKGSWKDFNSFRYCNLHRCKFDYLNSCPKYSSNNNHKQLQAITSNSQTPVILKRRYVRKVKDSVWERFHNYGVKFNSVVEWDHIFVEPTRLNNNVSYKRLDFSDAFVKVFRKSILVTLRASKEVRGELVKDAFSLSWGLVLDVLKLLPKAVIVSDNEVVNVHNAFVNHPTARLFKKVFGREMSVKDSDGKVHIITDSSHGNPETEHVNPLTAIPQSEYRESYEADLFFNKPKFPSEISHDVDNIKDTLNEVNKNLVEQNRVTLLEIENKKLHMSVLYDIKDAVKELKSEVSNVSCHSVGFKTPLLPMDDVDCSQEVYSSPENIPPTLSKYSTKKDRIRVLKSLWW
jgi:hypothetical protein